MNQVQLVWATVDVANVEAANVETANVEAANVEAAAVCYPPLFGCLER